uniref:Uncharacterized protein n=1 Tax=Triticum urartu TaxID=4572 RepID=A0A8R7P5T8_TRIUA
MCTARRLSTFSRVCNTGQWDMLRSSREGMSDNFFRSGAFQTLNSLSAIMSSTA